MNRSYRTGTGVTIVALLLILLFLPWTAVAQQATAKIVGTVTDPQGAVLPGVKVTVTNTATDLKTDTVTDRDGFFQVLNLPIGVYQVRAVSTGFRELVSTTPQLQINQVLRLDLHMQIGARQEIVEVQSAATTVETVNPTLGASITSRPVVDLPLNGRNVLQLALSQPGVTETNGTPNGTSNSQAGGFSVSGGKSDSVTYLLDGGINNNLLSNGVVYNPNPDTVAEFRILKSNYSAEYGRNAGGIVSVVTKSGTNTLHGSAYDFLRNDYFNANSYFNKQSGDARDVLKRNQFGGTLGGPIVKDKLFWFVGYQGQRLTQTVLSPKFTTFTPAELAGDFSHSGPGGTPDPGVVAYLQANPSYQPNPALAAQGIISPAAIDTVAKNYIAAGMIPTSPNGDIRTHQPGRDNNNEVTVKVDWVPTDSDRISATLGMFRNPRLIPFSGGSYAPKFGMTTTANRYFSNINYTHTFSPMVLNEFHFTAQRSNQFQSVPAYKWPDSAQLGVGITPDDSTGPPRVSFDKGLVLGFSPQGPTRLVDNTFLWSDTLSWIKGKHTLKFGFLYSPYYNNTVYDFYVDGEFDFYGVDGSFSGNSFADFLMGNPDEYFQFGRAPSNIRTHQYSTYAQDEWHVAPNLVLTFGLRYEYSSPKYDTQGRSFSLKLGAQSQRFPNAPLGLLFPGDPGAPKGANFPDRNDFAPRFGFAWDPTRNGKTSIRGGFGVFYDVLKAEDNLQFNGQAPFFGYADIFPSPGPTGATNGLADPFGSAGAPNPFPSKPPDKNIDFEAAGFIPFGGGGVYFVDPHLRTPYTYQYNLSIEHQLRNSIKVETSYVGSITHKQTALSDSNPFVLGTFNRLFNSQTGVQFGNSSFSYLDTFRNVVNANYNSLQAGLTKQLSSGNKWLGHSYFSVGYTWAKSIDTASGFRNNSAYVPFYDPAHFRAVSDYDIQHRLTFSGGWDLPFNEVFSSNRLTKGWSLYPIVTYRTGFPVDIRAFLNRGRTRYGPSGAGDNNLVHPNLNAGGMAFYDPHQVQSIVDPYTGDTISGNFWFNPADLNYDGLSSTYPAGQPNPVTDPALRTYGSLSRNAFRAPHRTNVDLALAKVTPITERVSAEFRAEAFNLFNFAEWNDPSTSVGDTHFGQIISTADPRILQFALRIRF